MPEFQRKSRGAAGSSRAEGPRIADAPIIVDALLGTGSSGAPRDTVAAAIEIIDRAGRDGAVAIALDVPSGLDATTGEHELCVEADLTLTFGVVKRGLLLARDVCGEIVVLDIGLAEREPFDSLPLLIDHDWVAHEFRKFHPMRTRAPVVDLRSLQVAKEWPARRFLREGSASQRNRLGSRRRCGRMSLRFTSDFPRRWSALARR